MIRILAQMDPVTVKAITDGADYLSSKDLKWLFFATGIAFLIFILAVIKFLLIRDQKYNDSRDTREKELTNQLSEQRAANSATQERLLGYITTDHMQCVALQGKVAEAMADQTSALAKLIQAIERINPR